MTWGKRRRWELLVEHGSIQGQPGVPRTPTVATTSTVGRRHVFQKIVVEDVEVFLEQASEETAVAQRLGDAIFSEVDMDEVKPSPGMTPPSGT